METTIENGQVIKKTVLPLGAYIVEQRKKLDINNQTLLRLQTQAEKIIADNTAILTELESLTQE